MNESLAFDICCIVVYPSRPYTPPFPPACVGLIFMGGRMGFAKGRMGGPHFSRSFMTTAPARACFTFLLSLLCSLKAGKWRGGARSKLEGEFGNYHPLLILISVCIHSRQRLQE